MQASKTSGLRRTFAMLCLCSAGWLASSAIAQNVPEHQGHMAAHSRLELGTGVAADAQGRIWIAGKEGAGAEQYVVLQVSDDGGKTWSAAKRVQSEPEPVSADGENRPKIAIGPKGEVYVAYTKPLAKPYTGEIRFARSLDGGKTFSAPITVHANRDVITHRFESMIVDASGRIYIAWIDKRDVEAAAARKQKYAGAALYYAVSSDSGASFKGDYKIAGHSCECCRIGLALDAGGKPVALWRHVFDSSIRDHAMTTLSPDGNTSPVVRATFDNWRIDACPHHGPSLAYAADGTRHQVWFNVKDDEGGAFYASANAGGKMAMPIKLGTAQAEHPDVAVEGKTVAIVWKQFDGKSTAIFGRLSADGGQTWVEKEMARTAKDSDQPHLFNAPSGIQLAWRTQEEGMRIIPVKAEK